MEKPWEGYMKPFKILGNLYFVGTEPSSSHLICTEEGLILLDSGYPQSLYLVIQGMWELGFNPKDIKYILHTHGHYDHLGATKALVELCGARTFIGAEDKDYANGTLDMTWANELGHKYYEMFEPDVLLSDGDVIELGSVQIVSRAMPGHTPGSMAYFFNIADGGNTYRAALSGGVGLNSVTKDFLDSHGLPYTLRQQYIDAMDRLKEERVDIFLGNHSWSNHTKQKYEQMQKGDRLAFVAPNEWKQSLESCKQAMLDMIEKEKQNS